MNKLVTKPDKCCHACQVKITFPRIRRLKKIWLVCNWLSFHSVEMFYSLAAFVFPAFHRPLISDALEPLYLFLIHSPMSHVQDISEIMASSCSAYFTALQGSELSVTYGVDREDEVSKIFIISLLCVWRVLERFLSMRNGFKFLKHVESKNSQFEIIFKSWARLSTQFS